MFGFRLINNDGNVSIDEQNPVYSFISSGGAVTVEDPKPFAFNPGGIVGGDGGHPLGSALNILIRFAIPLETVEPPLLFGRDKPGATAATIIAGVAVVGSPGNWRGIRLAITTTAHLASSTDALTAYRTVRDTVCDLALAVPGGEFSPGVSLRVANASGRLIFDALNHHPSYDRRIVPTFSRKYVFSQSVINTINVYSTSYTLSDNEWVFIGAGVGQIGRPSNPYIAQSFVSFGRGQYSWWGTRYNLNTGEGDVFMQVESWIARTRRRVQSTLVLPDL